MKYIISFIIILFLLQLKVTSSHGYIKSSITYNLNEVLADKFLNETDFLKNLIHSSRS